MSDPYGIMYEAGIKNESWNRPFEGKEEQEFHEWMMGYLDGLGDAGHKLSKINYNGLIERLGRQDYKEWAERWIPFIPCEGVNT